MATGEKSEAAGIGRFRTFFDSIEEGAFIAEVIFDEAGEAVDHRFLAANAAWEDTTGLKGVIGKRISEIAPNRDPHWSTLYGEVVRTGEPARVVEEAPSLGRWFVVTATRLGGDDSREVAVIVKDVTIRHRAAADLRDARDRLEAREKQLQFALKAGRMGTWSLDLVTNTLDASDICKTNYGRPADAPFTYQDLGEAVLAEDREHWQEQVADAAAAGRDFVLEYRTQWPDGSIHWVSVRGSCARNTSGQTIGMSGVSLRIDEQKLAEEALRVAARQKDEFLATASHELRTPLNAILGWSRLLRSGRLDAPATQKGIEAIERNAVSQVQMIEDILDGSRVTSGKLKLQVRPLDLTELVDGALDVVRPAAEARQITLTSDLNADAVRVTGDPDRLQQVIWNLVNNAIKFTAVGGSVVVRLARAGTNVALTVTDTGQGMAPDFVPHVFERFLQADSTSTRRHGGLGLGLTLVRHLVEAHGGRVRAESPGLGLGSTFEVKLPIKAVFPAPASIEDAQKRAPVDVELPPAALHGVTVLVVDDDDDARDVVAEVLRANGAQVTTVESARRALEAMASFAPAVLVSDVGMPEMDGHELVRRVRRSDGHLATLSAVALTAYAREEDRRMAMEAGFQMHVAKPVEPAELVRVVARLSSMQR